MVAFISFHSLKGGTGKTTISSNVAALGALHGQNVCLMDLDFRAPSLHVFFKTHPDLWLNDFLNDKCDIKETLQDVAVNGKGRLAVGFADPSTEAMRDMMTKDREWEANALRHLLSARAMLQREEYDLVVLDTSPGIQYSSFNALAVSNLVILVMNRDELYRDEVVDLVNKIYKPLGRKIGIALNKVLFCPSDRKNEKSKEVARQSIQLKKTVEDRFGCPVFALIPCFCDVLVGGYEVYTLSKPGHPFTAEMSTVADRILSSLR